jgi:hypothetical protein
MRSISVGWKKKLLQNLRRKCCREKAGLETEGLAANTQIHFWVFIPVGHRNNKAGKRFSQAHVM